MIEHVFDPEIRTAPISVKTDPGLITVGETDFLEPHNMVGLELSPIQATLLILALTRAIEAEMRYSTEFEEFCKGRNGRGMDADGDDIDGGCV